MRTIAAIATHPSFQAYRAALTNFATLNVTHETGIRSAFQNLLQTLAAEAHMTLVPEQVVDPLRLLNTKMLPFASVGWGQNDLRLFLHQSAFQT